MPFQQREGLATVSYRSRAYCRHPYKRRFAPPASTSSQGWLTMKIPMLIVNFTRLLRLKALAKFVLPLQAMLEMPSGPHETSPTACIEESPRVWTTANKTKLHCLGWGKLGSSANYRRYEGRRMAGGSETTESPLLRTWRQTSRNLRGSGRPNLESCKGREVTQGSAHR